MPPRPPSHDLPTGLRALAAALLVALAAGCPAPPEILPPPFGPDPAAKSPARLFFPTGLAVAKSGYVLVVNSNFDRAYDFGEIASIDPVYIAGIFARPPVDTNDPTQPVPEDIPKEAFKGSAITGSYGGPLLIDDKTNVAVFGSRDTSVLNGVQLDPATGALSCVKTGGVDCRSGIIDLGPELVDSPFGLASGVARLPGSAVDQSVLFVSSLAPYIDSISDNTVYSRGRVAALSSDDPTQVVFSTDTSNFSLANGIAGGPLVFDAYRRRMILGGCYQRYPSATTGIPTTAKCGIDNAQNLLRFIGVDEGDNAEVRLVDISAYVRSNDTAGLALGNFDPVTHAPRTLYAAVRNPDLIAEIDLPDDPTELPTVQRAAPLPVSPSNVLRLQRPPDASGVELPGRDLLVVTASGSNSLDIYDSTASQVVARVEALGTTPYAVAQLPPQVGDQYAQIVVSVFSDCRISLVDVSYDQPWRSRLRARLGELPAVTRRTLRALLFASALAALLAAGAFSACGSTVNVVAGDLSSPAGLAVAPARDRDLLFIANQGGNELRVISICRSPANPDGTSTETTCEDVQDFQFLPGPIRVFPGSFPSGPRPSRLASVWLRDAQNVPQGALIVGGIAAEANDGGEGALPVLKMLDTNNVWDAVSNAAPLKEPLSISLEAPPVDVVALQPLPGVDPLPGASAPVFILTQQATGVPAEILVASVSPGDNGPTAVGTGRCSLDFLGTRLALIGGQSDKLYVADGSPDGTVGGTGDGVVEILTNTIPPLADGAPVPCTLNRRISAEDPATHTPQPLIAVTMAPRFRTADGRNFAAGDILGGITQDGRVVLLSQKLGGPLPLPPYVTPYVDDLGNNAGNDATVPHMEPLRTNGIARDLIFLNQPLECPATKPDGTPWPPGAPCVLVRVGVATETPRSVDFALVAATSSSDGSVYFIDADKRRFISETRDGIEGEPPPTPTITSAPAFLPVQPNGQDAPTFTFEPAETDANGAAVLGGHDVGWFTPGVARRALWRAVWHSPIPGLARRGSTLTRSADGNLHLELADVDLTRWTSAALLDVGDTLAFEAFNQPNPQQPLCNELVSENVNPLAREYRILAIEPSGLVITPIGEATAGDDGGVPPEFSIPDSCLPVGAVAEIRASDGFAGSTWLISEGSETRGRAKNGVRFIGYETRFDYPLNYPEDPPPPAAPSLKPTPDRNTAVAFTITGPEPIVPGSFFTWAIDSAHQPTNVRDVTNSFGFAGPLTIYTSKKIKGNLVFVSQSGANAVLQIDPSLIGVTNGVLAYR